MHRRARRTCRSGAALRRRAGMRRPDGTFVPGHSLGRPVGVRNKLAKEVFTDALRHWTDPVMPGSAKTKGQAALELVFHEDPVAYLRFMGDRLPKEFAFDAATSELDDDQVDELIFQL